MVLIFRLIIGKYVKLFDKLIILAVIILPRVGRRGAKGNKEPQVASYQ